MQVPPLETHRRDGLFFKYSTRGALSPVSVSDTPLKLPGHVSSSFEKGAPQEKRRGRGTANGSRVEALIESWETAKEKRGESGQQDIKRSSSSSSGGGGGGGGWCSGSSEPPSLKTGNRKKAGSDAAAMQALWKRGGTCRCGARTDTGMRCNLWRVLFDYGTVTDYRTATVIPLLTAAVCMCVSACCDHLA